MADVHDFVGQRHFRFSMSGMSPFVRGVIPADADPDAVAKAIEADVRKAIEKHLLYAEFTSDRFGEFIQVDGAKDLIKTKEDEQAYSRRLLAEIQELCQESEKQRQEEIANNPDNGKSGYWQVNGIRHDGMVKASSEQEAIDKALEYEVVSSWESPRAYFIGETVPELD